MSADTRLVADRPATSFVEAFPLGNGAIGLMPCGGIDRERVVINEAGCWSGSPQEADRDGAAALPEIRSLLLAGRYREAEALVHANFTCSGAGSGLGNGAAVPFGCYQVFGELDLEWPALAGIAAGAYRRELDLDAALASTSFTAAGASWRREAFVSHPGRVAALRLTGPPGQAIRIALARPERADLTLAGGDLLLTVRLPDGRGGVGVTAVARLRVLAPGGTVTPTPGGLEVRCGAAPAVLLLAALTDMRSFAGVRADDPAAAAGSDLDHAAALGWDALLAAHQADHRALFQRVRLDLGDGAAALPTVERLHAGGDDPALAALLFTYGRYLLIASSRPGGLPANLQGLWADGVQTPWNGDWHLNINVQMNYWLAGPANLQELEEPFFALIDALRGPGAQTARAYYGAGGWVAHVVTNPWGFTSPGEHASWGATVSGAAWCCTHLWNHWLSTRDRAALAAHWPALRDAARFHLDSLVAAPDGRLVTAPSNSPELGFVLPDGGTCHVCAGPTIDCQILRALFTGVLTGLELLGDDDATLHARLREALDRLPPTRTTPDGRIAEWLHDLPESEPHHRHVSPLWGLHPGSEISPDATPALAAAARRTLERRGDDGTGWSLAWKVLFWARLGDGARAAALLRRYLRPVQDCGMDYGSGGGTYPNLFCAHPPFQIDGNLGICAAICELLLQGRWSGRPADAPLLRLLPALPPHWRRGEVRGLRAIGAASVDIAWEDGRLDRASVIPDQDGPWEVDAGGTQVEATDADGRILGCGRRLRLDLRAGQVCHVAPTSVGTAGRLQSAVS